MNEQVNNASTEAKVDETKGTPGAVVQGGLPAGSAGGKVEGGKEVKEVTVTDL